MPILGGTAEGIRMRYHGSSQTVREKRMGYQEYSPHIIGGKMIELAGVPGILQTPEWRERYDKAWNDHANVIADLSEDHDERERINNHLLGQPLKIIVADNVLRDNSTSSHWRAKKSMLERAAALAEDGKLRVMSRLISRTYLPGPYSFGLYYLDKEGTAKTGSKRIIQTEDIGGNTIYPIVSDDLHNTRIARRCDTTFDTIWTLAGYEAANGTGSHLQFSLTEIEPTNNMREDLAGKMTTRYIEELISQNC